MMRSIFCVYRLAAAKNWTRLCVESDSRQLVVIASYWLKLIGYRRIATGTNVNAVVVWTFDKGACPYRQE
jgi:hypothetical protein